MIDQPVTAHSHGPGMALAPPAVRAFVLAELHAHGPARAAHRLGVDRSALLKIGSDVEVRKGTIAAIAAVMPSSSDQQPPAPEAA